MTSAIKGAIASITMMNVYLKTGARDHLMFLTPAKKDSPDAKTLESEDYLMPDGSPRQLTIRFVAGKAKVEKSLGQWMLDKGLCQKTPSTIVVVNRHLTVDEPKVRHHHFLRSEAPLKLASE